MAAMEEAWNEAENLSIGPPVGHSVASAAIHFRHSSSRGGDAGAFLDAKTSLAHVLGPQAPRVYESCVTQHSQIRGCIMKPRSKKFVRPVITPFGEDADSAAVARIFAEVDAGAGSDVHVTVDFKITVHPRHARGFAGAVRELETSSAELSDERLPDQQPDAPGDGSYIIGLFGTSIPVSKLKTRRRRLGRRR
jgi:hypothetical protein